MKRKVWIFLTIGLTVAVAVGVTVLILVNRSLVWEFDLEEYQEEIAMFPSDKHVGPVEDASTAIEKAKELWTEIYGKKQAQEQKPYRVSYDKKAGVWLVEGRFHLRNLGQKGGVAHLLITDEGDVLAVWHTK